MTQDQRERLIEAFDILCSVYWDMESKNGKLAKRLDTILGKLEQLINMR